MLFCLHTSLLATILMHIVDQTYQAYIDNTPIFLGATLIEEKNQTLPDAPIKVVNVSSTGFPYVNCMSMCFKTPECLSFNLGAFMLPGSDRLYQCQLLQVDKYSSRKPFEDNNAFNHYSFETGCASFPCLNNGTCVTSPRNASYTCKCPHNMTGDNCGKRWEKQSESLICFGARRNDFGRFYARRTGKIHSFRFVHVSGQVSCETTYSHRYSYWGCLYPDKPEPERSKYMLLIITDKHKTLIFPSVAGKYSLPGVTNMDEILELPEFASPLQVTVGQELRMWYYEDLIDKSERDNHGRSCSYVYAKYSYP